MGLRRCVALCVWLPTLVLMGPILTLGAFSMFLETTIVEAWGAWSLRLDRWSRRP